MRPASAIVFFAITGMIVIAFHGDRLPQRGGRPGYDKPDEAARHFTGQRAWPDGIPSHWFDRARSHIHTMEEKGLRKQSDGWRWLSLGPVNIAGRLRDMALDPRNPATIYGGSAGGGVWKSTNSGHDWRLLDDLLPNLRIGAIAVDPHHPDRVLAGCGEGYVAWQGGAAFGSGIYASPDAGENWELLASTGRAEFNYVYDIDFDPFLENVLLACTGSGVFRSVDGGDQWRRVLTRPVLPFSAMVEYSATHPGVVYAAIEGAGIFRSANHGEDWVGPLGNGIDVAQYSRIVLAAAPSDGNILYAAFTGADQHCAGIFRSDDGGEHWRAVSIPLSDMYGDSYMGGQGRFNSALTVHPADPDILWAGGIDLYRSTDGGRRWKQMTNWFRTKNYTYVHADNHVIIFNPGNHQEILTASDGGLFRSTDGGESFTEKSAGMETVQFHSATPHPRTDFVIGGTIDNGTIAAFDGQHWSEVAGGDGGYTAIDPVEPRYMYTELYYLHFMRSTDFGRSFQVSMIGIPRTTGFGTSDPVAFIAPFEMAQWDPKTLFAGSNRVYRSTNRAESWEPISPNLAGDGYLTAIGLSASDPATIYVGSWKGRAQVSTDGGSSWRRIDAGLPQRWITDIAVHGQDSRRAVFTVSGFGTGHVYLTSDGGENWTDISGTTVASVPDVPVNTVLWHPQRDSTLYVGTDVGLFVTTNLGATWQVDNNGIGNVVVADLKLRGDGVLFAATHGRGMYRSSMSVFDGAAIPPVAATLSAPYPNPVSAGEGLILSVPYTIVRRGAVRLRATDISGRTLVESDQGMQGEGEYTQHFDAGKLAAGALTLQLFVDGMLVGERRVMVLR